MQTNYAKIVAEALIKQGAILVGSQALIESSTADIDIACTWEQYLAVLEAEPMLNENNKYIKLHKNDYTKSTKALWNGVAFLTFIDGTELDILLYDEDFSKSIQGWNMLETTQCGGITMLGGYGTLSVQKIFKKFENLPNHTSLKVQFNYHFIDAWDQESGFMQANIRTGTGDYEYLWIENYTAFMGDLGVNVCGGKWPEGKFSVPVEVTFPHQSSSVSLQFGSTLNEDPYNASFGISSLRIYFK